MELPLALTRQITRADCGFPSYPIAPATLIIGSGWCPRPWIERRTPALIDARLRFAFLGSGIDVLACRRTVGPGSRVRSICAAADLCPCAAWRGGDRRNQHAGAGRQSGCAERRACGGDPAGRVRRWDRAARGGSLRARPQTGSHGPECAGNGGTKAAIGTRLAGASDEPFQRSIIRCVQSSSNPHYRHQRLRPSRVPTGAAARQSATTRRSSDRDGVYG
jgi:hypothetical protein